MLYTPLLLEHNYKTKHVKPLNVTFAVSDPDEVRYTLRRWINKHSMFGDLNINIDS